MASNNDDEDEVPKSVFREVSTDSRYRIDDTQAYRPEAIAHYSSLPKNQRSHEDFDDLLKIIKIMNHNSKFQEKELWMAHKRISGYKQANAGHISLNKSLARQLINDSDGQNENLTKVMKRYKRAILSKVVSVKLNEKMYTITYAHMMHIFEWYSTGGMFQFTRGNDYMGVGEDAQGCHQYTFGEVVQRTFFDREGNKHKDEVILFDETSYIVDVVSADEIRRAGTSQKDGFTMPSFVWKEDIEPLSPRRYLLDEEKMTNLMHKMMGWDDSDEDTWI